MIKDARQSIDVFIDSHLTGMGAYWADNVYAVSRHWSAT